jgi:hypothetical protein
MKVIKNFTGKPEKIFITGYCGAGKTTYAKQLANELGYEVIHLDELLEGFQGSDEEYDKYKYQLIVDLMSSKRRNVVIEGVQLLKIQTITLFPLVILTTNPYLSAFRQSISKNKRNRIWPLSFFGALNRNIGRWSKYYNAIMNNVALSPITGELFTDLTFL